MSVMSRLPFESFCPFLHLLNSQHECPIYQNYPKLSKTAVCSVARTHSSHRRKEHIPPLDWCGGDLEQLELSPEAWGNMRKDRAGDMLGIRSQTGKKMQKCILTFQTQWMSTASAALLWVLQGILWGSTSLAHSHRIIPSHEKLAPFLHVPFFGLLMRTQIWFRVFAMLLGKNMDWTNFWLCISQSTVQAFGTTKLPWHDLGMQARFRRKKWHLFQMPVSGYSFRSALAGHSRAGLGPAHSNSEPKQCSTQTPEVQFWMGCHLFRHLQVDSAQGGQRKFPVGSRVLI